MKNLLLMVIAGLFCTHALAQVNGHLHATSKQPGKHGKLVAVRKKMAPKDTVAMNFKVCKSDKGYTICGEAPDVRNTTYNEAVKPVKRPVYEANKTDVIVLKGIPQIPKVQLPASTPGPESQSGAWFGASSWNGIW